MYCIEADGQGRHKIAFGVVADVDGTPRIDVFRLDPVPEKPARAFAQFQFAGYVQRRVVDRQAVCGQKAADLVGGQVHVGR